MARLSIQLLGPFQVSLDGQPVTSFGYDHVRALLVYLASESDRPHRRGRLAGLLWPEQPHSQSLSNLRYALYRLRKATDDPEAEPPFLLISRTTLQFNQQSDHELDLADFQHHLAQAQVTGRPAGRRNPEAAGHASRDHLEAAAQVYRGALLEGFTLPNSPLFEEWLVLKREHLAQEALEALRCLLHLHLANQDYAAAERAARRLLSLEPWDEEGHRRLMSILALSGRRSAALSQYQTCRRTLAEELGVKPDDNTTALYRQIREGRFHGARDLPAPRRPQPAQVAQTPAPRFVARSEEMAELRVFLHRALSGQGRVAFVTGEPGAGKTTLIHAFVRQSMARHKRLVAAAGRCSARGGVGDPFLPFREILQTLTGDIEAYRAGGAISSDHARRLWGLFPEAVDALLDEGPDLIGRFVPAEPLVLRAQAFAPGESAWQNRIQAVRERQGRRAAPNETDQIGLFDQVTRFLETLADQHPLVLVVDDLQWADAGTASLLFHLARRVSVHRVLILAAYRPGDLAPGADGRPHPVESVVHELQRRYGHVRVDLNQADGGAFVQALVDSEPNRLDNDFRETLHRHTGGNPLFTVELLRGLQERGDVTQDASGRWMADPGLIWDRLPARVEGVIAERVGRLPSELRENLIVASVEGETFTAEVVARARGLDEAQVVAALSGPLSKDHRLIVADSVRRVGGRRLSRYRFRHTLFQTFLYQEQDTVQRARRHEAVGKALETFYGDRATEISRDLAQHFEAARMLPEAVTYLLEAGKRANELSASEEAVAVFRHGLKLLDHLPASANRDRQEFALRVALYAPLTTTRGYAGIELARSHARVEQLAARLGQERDVMPVLISLAGFHSFRAEFEQGTDLAHRGLKLAESLNAPGHAVWATQILGMIRLSTGDPAAAQRQFDRADAVEDPDHAAMLALRGRAPRVVHRAFSAWAQWLLGRPHRAQRLGQEAVALAEAADHPPSLALALFVGAIMPNLLCRDYDVVRLHVGAFDTLSAQHTLGLSQGGVQLALGRVLVHEGDPRAGLEAMKEGLAKWEATGTKVWRSLYLMLMAEACLEADELPSAAEALDRAFEVVAETGEGIVEAELERLRGELWSVRGQAEQAETSFRRALSTARRQGARSWELRAATSLVRHLRQQGRGQEACTSLAEIYEQFSEPDDTPDLIEAQRELARCQPGGRLRKGSYQPPGDLSVP